ncbi:MAG TPA: hypothetical protein VI542_33120 [Candidatus Tectomicrobia bacterium]
MEREARWWDALQVGDKVILKNRGYTGFTKVAYITRLTNAQLFAGDHVGQHGKGVVEWAFWKKNGKEVGRDWANTELLPFTEEAAAHIQQATLQRRIQEWGNGLNRPALDHLTIAQCQDILACLNRHGLLRPG